VQVAFNMVSRYGESSRSKLSSVVERILEHYRKITSGEVLLPSVEILQAPVFHGHAVSMNVQLASPAVLGRIESALAGEHISLVRKSDEAPSNVNAAGQGDILVSLTPDIADPASLWIWAASDNLRVAASTAVEVAESMAAVRPKGKI